MPRWFPSLGFALIVLVSMSGPARAKEGDVPPDAAPFAWASIGPTFIAPTDEGYDVVGSTGRVSSIALSANGVLAATANGGVWKRTGAGSWDVLTDGRPNLAFGAVAVAPSNANVLYAGTGEDHACIDCGSGDDIYKSTDGGATWTTLAPLLHDMPATGMQTSAIAVDPRDPNVVWVGGTLGVFRSRDGGATWTTIEAAATGYIAPIVDLKLDPEHPDIAYFTDRRHVIKDDDGTLRDVTAPAVATYEAQVPAATFAIALALAPSDPNVLYTAYAFSGNVDTGCLAGLFKSSDGGGTWVAINVSTANDYFSSAYAYGGGSTSCQGWYDNALAVDPTDPNHLVGAGIALVDFDTRVPAAPNQRNLSAISHVHPDHHALAFDAEGDLYDGGDGGVWYFPKAALAPGMGAAGENVSAGLAVTTFSSGVSVFGDGSGTVFAGSQDNGSEVYAQGSSGWSWRRLATGDGGYTAVDPHQANVLYHEYFQGNIERSTDGGATWTGIAPNFAGQSVSWIMPYKMDANDALRLIAGASRPFVTTTGGVGSGGASGWNATNPNDFTEISAIDLSPGGTAIVIGDSEGNVRASFDGGATWQPTTVPGSVTTVKIDPYSDRTFWVASRDSDEVFVPHLVRVSVPSGGTPATTSVVAGLTSPVESLLLLPDELLAGTDRGVFVRGRSCGPWSPQRGATSAAPEIPAVPVMDLAFRTGGASSQSGSLVALTHGRGAWVSNDISYLYGNENLFVADYRDYSVKEFTAANGYTTAKTIGSGFSAPQGVAVDASGNVFVADYGHYAIKEILAAGGYATVRTIGSGFLGPLHVAVDTAGNVFFTDWDNLHVPHVSAVRELVAAGGYTTVRTIGSGFTYATGVALDRAGNLFVADAGFGQQGGALKEVLAAGGYTTVRTLAGGLFNPRSLALDAAGNAYTVSVRSTPGVQEIVAAGGYTTVRTLGSGFIHPSGVALDPGGNVFVADWGYGNGVVGTGVKEAVATGGYATMRTLGAGLTVATDVALSCPAK